MAENDELAAWLEHEGQQLEIGATFSIGRLDTCDLTIADDEVSRRHAIIQRQDTNEHWLIDLASSNGTNLNQNRLTLPTKLQDGDVIEIGGIAVVFRQRPSEPDLGSTSPAPPATSISIVTAERWLLVVDIIGSTTLAASMPAAELATVTGKWMLTCSDVIKSSHGVVNKYLGDGFLAYWRDDASSANGVRTAIASLSKLQADPDVLDFRVVLHFGQVAVGGSAAVAEESLTGLNVGFAFRMEHLASELGQHFLISAPARDALPPDLKLRDIGLHQLPNSGHDKPLRFFALA